MLFKNFTHITARIINFVKLEVLEVDADVVAGDEALKLGSGEHGGPLEGDDGAKAAQERPRLPLDLRVEAKVGQRVDVHEPLQFT